MQTRGGEASLGLHWVHPRETLGTTGLLLPMLSPMQATLCSTQVPEVFPVSTYTLFVLRSPSLFPEDLSLILCFQYLNTVIGLSPGPALGDC